jgi:adenylate cyclase
MFTDIVGYSALAQQDEAAAIDALDRHNRALRAVFAKFHGREVKTIGDAFLIEFGSALDAVLCAVEMQKEVQKLSPVGDLGRSVQIRIGIHVGDVIEANGDVLGDAVNIASRIEPLATPGGICLSQQVYDQVQNKVHTTFVKLPRVGLKNIQIPMDIYRITSTNAPRAAALAEVRGSKDRHLAVLPLTNISHESEDEYFADGLTEELISVLSQIRGLSVIARTSVMPYKSAPKSIAQVGEELGVDVVLEGSVRKSGNKVRVSLQLVDAITQNHLWAGSVNRELDDVFEVQSYVAGRAARALRLTLNRTQRSAPRAPPVPNPKWGVVTAGDAYDAYLRGLVSSSTMSEAGPEEAFRWFERATTLDPSLADAWAAWANLYVIAAGDYFPFRDVMPRARELAARALELDPDSSDAHATLANIALQFDNDWTAAESEFQTAIALNPSNATAYKFYGTLLVALDRVDEAKQAFRHLVRLDPSGHHRGGLAWAELAAGNLEAALKYLKDEDRHDGHPAHHAVMRGLFFVEAGHLDEARKEIDNAPSPENDDERFDQALVRAMLGTPAPARAILKEIAAGGLKTYISSAHLAMLYGALGENEKALELLEKDFREGDHILWLHYRASFFDGIRSDPRFLGMMREMGLPIHPLRGWVPPKEFRGNS